MYKRQLIGCVTTNKKYSEALDEYLHTIESYTNSHDCYLALRGLRTLQVRLSAHQKSAFKIARWLEREDIVDCVIHPGLERIPSTFSGREIILVHLDSLHLHLKKNIQTKKSRYL